MDHWYDAYEERLTRCGGPVYARVYREDASVAHLAEEDGYLDILCRDSGPDSNNPIGYAHAYPEEGWYGTGSQHEYEVAAALPLCTRCFAIREQRLPDPNLGAGHGEEMS